MGLKKRAAMFFGAMLFSVIGVSVAIAAPAVAATEHIEGTITCYYGNNQKSVYGSRPAMVRLDGRTSVFTLTVSTIIHTTKSTSAGTISFMWAVAELPKTGASRSPLRP